MTDAPLIPLERFFDNPERSSAGLSPDGRWLSYLAPVDGFQNIFVRPVAGGDAVQVTHDGTRSITAYRWAKDSRHIIYGQDAGGDENTHQLAVDITAPDEPARDLTPWPGARSELSKLPVHDPGAILVSTNRREPSLFDLVRVDIATGEATVVFENPGNLMGIDADEHGRVSVGFGMAATGEWEILDLREAGAIRSVARYASEDVGLVPNVAGSADGGTAYIAHARGSDVLRLYALDLATGEETSVDPTASSDVGTPIFSRVDGSLIAVPYDRERLEIVSLDPAFDATLAALKALDAGDLAGFGSDASGAKYVAAFNDDRAGVKYWLYDVATGAGELLFTAWPELDASQLAPMTPVTITARDGLAMTCYLTLPVGSPAGGLPMVLNVHGGPWARDSWGFNPEVQFLANRGYAVLQVNYRGSLGFGKAFSEAAVREFSGKMHDDLIDAVEWAVKEGYADPARVAIYGGSYGGYAALVGITFTPDVFAAAVSYVGPSNLVTLMESFPAYWRPAMASTWFKFVGDPEIPADLEDMKARSPITRVDAIVTPLLVAQGANDPRVTQVESDQIVEALRSRGVAVEYILADNEGHGFLNIDNRFRLYHAMETFFAEHLGGRTA